MGGRLVMRMVPGMFDGLRLSQTANGQHTQYQDNRDKFTGWVVHR